MTEEMSFKTAVLLLLMFAMTKATKVNLTSSWKTDVGWVAECSWTLFSNDSLQSVRLTKNEQQFWIYRPEMHGERYTKFIRLSEAELSVECAQTAEKGVLGRCILTLYLTKPPVADLNYICEVSGERPTFFVDKEDINVPAFVPPSDAVIKLVTLTEQSSGQVKLKCTSTGIPAPRLTWRIGDQRVPQDFSGSSWNSTSKLWDVWSEFSYTPSGLVATCTPDSSLGGELIRGQEAEYSAAPGMAPGKSTPGVQFVIIAMVSLTLHKLFR